MSTHSMLMSPLTRWLFVALTVAGPVPALYAQTPSPGTPAAAAPRMQRLTIDEAVALALENNLGLEIARINPRLQDLTVAQASAAWSPTFTSTLQGASSESPNNSFLSGAQGTSITDARLASEVAVEQALRWGGRYSVGWDGSRSTTNNLFSNFSPQIRSSLALSYQQPLLRGFSIDPAREQLLVSRTNREIADVSLRQSVAGTTRAVRNAYWDLAFAVASLDVQRQSLALAATSLRNTRARVEIGTTPPIDVVEAEAEVALRTESVIVAEAQIATAEDALRILIYPPAMQDFWAVRLEPSNLPTFLPIPVDVDASMRNALERRTDLQQLRKSLDASDISVRLLRNQTLPDITAAFDYGLTGLGGTQFLRGQGFPGPVIGESQRSFGSVIGDLFGNDFPNWTASLNVSYPLGATAQEAAYARARLQYSRARAEITSQEMQVAAEVRQAARQVLTNQRRVETTRVSRELAERRLEAEERKLAAGTSTSFVVFQVQRDLAVARNNELQATLDFNRSVVDFETVQDAPLGAAAP